MKLVNRRLVALLSVAALAACQGDKGTQGDQGPQGSQGPAGQNGSSGANGANGTNGISAGTVQGTVSYKPGATVYPATNVTVTTLPDVGVTATTDANGGFTLSLPVGIYTLKFSGNGFADLTTEAFTVVAGKTTNVAKTLTATNPVVATALTTIPNPAGFGAQVTLGVNVSGGTAPYTYKWVPAATSPTTVTLSSDTAAAPTFTTGSLADVLASNKLVGLESDKLALRDGLIALSYQQVTQSTYTFNCTVTDAKGFAKTVAVAVVPGTMSQGNGLVPRNQIVIANFLTANAAGQTFTKPAGSNATLKEATGKTPWFIPDVQGEYSVGGLKVFASDFMGSSPGCVLCHYTLPELADVKAKVDAKFKDWANSAHGNHFFKFMEYDASGSLVWKKDADGKYIPAPTANEGAIQYWSNVGPMTTFQYGLSGAEGTHYGASCMGCHFTGYNTANGIVNGGADDVMASAGWALPPLAEQTAAFGGSAATKQPISTLWDKVPQAVKNMAGMQCESCHGPLKAHATGALGTPKGEYNAAACAICHDRPAGHQKVALWRQSRHANLELAIDEGTRDTCGRCHSAQGYAQYAEALEAGLSPDAIASVPTKAEVEPITCAACHDAHTTGLRIEGDKPITIAAGLTISGVGTGALCMSCHNARRGAHGDNIPWDISTGNLPHTPTQTEVLLGANAYFVSGYTLSKHAFVADTCVGCHVKLHPDGIVPAVSNTNHVFSADATICKNCHGAGVNPEGIASQLVSGRASILASITNVITRGRTSFDLVGSSRTVTIDVATAKPALTNATRSGITLTFAAPVENPNAATGTVTSLTVALGKLVATGTTTRIVPNDNGVVAKALWNWALVNDGSNGVHNPNFVFTVIGNTKAAVESAAASTL